MGHSESTERKYRDPNLDTKYRERATERDGHTCREDSHGERGREKPQERRRDAKDRDRERLWDKSREQDMDKSHSRGKDREQDQDRRARKEQPRQAGGMGREHSSRAGA